MSGDAVIGLRAGPARASISPLGAELRDWSVDGLALSWPGDAASWPDVSPILFPIVGWARDGRVRIGGTAYDMPVHGFARELSFDAVERDADRVLLRAASSPATRRSFPFEWRLEVAYALSAAALDIAITVRNDDRTPMPYACGLHPGFRWPFAGGNAEDYGIEFAGTEAPSVPVIAPGGLFSAARRPVPLQGRRLPLTPALMEREALCFLHARSRSLVFAHRDGAAIAMALDGFPHIALWSRPPGRFLCLEAWTGHGDPEGFTGELAEKPSQRLLAPGAAARHAARYSFAADGIFVANGGLGRSGQS